MLPAAALTELLKIEFTQPLSILKYLETWFGEILFFTFQALKNQSEGKKHIYFLNTSQDVILGSMK